MLNRHKLTQRQRGQSLIETVVAIFIMTMGVVAAVGLANYSLHASTNITKQIIAMGLAREGVEAVKNMRDTNWLRGALNATGCYDYASGQAASAPCYQDWESAFYDFRAAPTKIVTLDFNPNTGATSAFWTTQTYTGTPIFGLNYDSSPSVGSGRLYSAANAATGSSEFYRKITIAKDTTTAPYNVDPNLPRLMVTSQVWWSGKSCPAVTDNPSSKCSITLVDYFTNWRNY